MWLFIGRLMVVVVFWLCWLLCCMVRLSECLLVLRVGLLVWVRLVISRVVVMKVGDFMEVLLSFGGLVSLVLFI